MDEPQQLETLIAVDVFARLIEALIADDTAEILKLIEIAKRYATWRKRE